MNNQNGPAELRLLIDNYDAMMGGPSATSKLMKRCAAAWEADRAALEPGHKCVGQPVCVVCALRAETSELRAALERARALASTWAAKQYNGDLTAAVYNGCADELAAALSTDGAR